MSEQIIDNNDDQSIFKKKTAIAVHYDEDDVAPRVVAKGKGEIAKRIIAVALENNIPIQEDMILASALSQVDLEEMIPPELYSVVAEILAFVYRLRLKSESK
ncbi:MAG: EscU/YscU/HrcU family type III secretion system export apparatus switch protein [Anaerolineaceae bacterium]|nr:EscU/YscU/HrcU family type III secretion system export apparatus switch protein [Anaerolineaceae bacterium]